MSRSIAPSWEKDSSILVEDGYVWRKYGQKMTLNAKYLRYVHHSSVSNESIFFSCSCVKALISKPWFQKWLKMYVGATTGALTRMIRDVMQWNRCREFKMFLLCTEQPITAITHVKALWILRLFWNLFLLLDLPRYLALVTAFIANKKTRFPHHYLLQPNMLTINYPLSKTSYYMIVKLIAIILGVWLIACYHLLNPLNLRMFLWAVWILLARYLFVSVNKFFSGSFRE